MKSRSVKTLRILGASFDLAAFGSQMRKVYSNIRSFSQSIGRATACLVALYIFAVMAGAAGTYTPATLGTKSTSNARKDGNRAADTFFRVREYNVFDPALFYPISTAINNDRSDLGAFGAQVAASDTTHPLSSRILLIQMTACAMPTARYAKRSRPLMLMRAKRRSHSISLAHFRS